jgi:hypothetical protein
MMKIEGHWESVDTLRDIARIVREYYNHELADKMDELIDMQNDEFLGLRSVSVYSEWDDDDLYND